MNVTQDGIRRSNERLVVEALRRENEVSRGELQELTGLSRTTLYRILQSLADREMIREEIDTQAPAQRGRPVSMLSLNPHLGAALGVELGRSQTAVALMNYSGETVASARVELSEGTTWEQSLAALNSMLDEAGADEWSAVRQVSAGLHGLMPSSVDYVDDTSRDRRVAQLRELLEQRFPVDVAIESNTRLAALAEYDQRGMTTENLLYCHLSRGVGSALVLGGELFAGSTNSSGEFGHAQIDPTGAPCHCGSRGCLETFVGLDHVMHRARGLDANAIRITDLADLALSDSNAIDLIRDVAVTLGRAIGNICNVINPAEVVLGGELVQLGDTFVSQVRDTTRDVALAQVAAGLTVSTSRLGSAAAATGAALKALHLVARDNTPSWFRLPQPAESR